MGFSATDKAIIQALKNNTIKVVERDSRLGGKFYAITDDNGTIEVADTRQECLNRMFSVVKLYIDNIENSG